MILLFFVFPFIPFFHSFLPVGLFTTFHSLLLPRRLITGFVAGTLGLHGLNGCIIKDLNGTALHCFQQLFLTKSLTRLIEVRDIKLIIHSQLMTDKLLLATVDRVLQSQQFTNLVYLFL